MKEVDFQKARFFLIIVLIVSLSIQIVLFGQMNSHDDLTGNAVTVGTVGIVICRPININFSNCNSSVFQNEYYSCQLELINNTDDANYTSEFVNIDRIFNSSSNESLFSVSRTGFFEFTADNNDVGNYTIDFQAVTGDGCGSVGNSNMFDLEVFNVNDAPVFTGKLDDLTLSQDQTFYGFYLSNYFSDPDMDELLYNVSGNSQISITCEAFISNSNPNPNSDQVIFRSEVCDISEIVRFYAFDPDNETAQSNLVNITVECDDDGQQEPPSSGGSGGGGGGDDEPITDTFRPRDLDYSHFEHEDCTENWNCTEWTLCTPNGTMTRKCVDLMNCGTTKYKPITIKNCTYNGTCDDGIKNCHDGGCEENIDCGGPCEACKFVEVAMTDFEGKDDIMIYVWSSIGLLLLGLAGYFHKTIMSSVYGAFAIFRKKKKEKKILLTNKQKDMLLEKLKKLESKIRKKNSIELFVKYHNIFRDYLMYVTNKKLSPEFNANELRDVLDNKSNNILKNVLNNMKRDKIIKLLNTMFVEINLRNKKIEQTAAVNKTKIRLLIEELRTIVIQTSPTEHKDIERDKIEIKSKGVGVNKVYTEMSNIYIALQFLEMSVVDKKYQKLIKSYNELHETTRKSIAADMEILGMNIEYIDFWNN